MVLGGPPIHIPDSIPIVSWAVIRDFINCTDPVSVQVQTLTLIFLAADFLPVFVPEPIRLPSIGVSVRIRHWDDGKVLIDITGALAGQKRQCPRDWEDADHVFEEFPVVVRVGFGS